MLQSLITIFLDRDAGVAPEIAPQPIRGVLGEYHRTSINQWMLIYASMLVSIFVGIGLVHC
jgi:hypothetical protein